jgi:hypothetical protein
MEMLRVAELGTIRVKGGNCGDLKIEGFGIGGECYYGRVLSISERFRLSI